MNNGVYHTDVNIICHNKNVMKMKCKHYGLWNIQIIIFVISNHYILKCKNEKCIWKIFVKYTQICQSNTNTNTNISSCGFSNTNTNTDIWYLNTNTNTYLTPALVCVAVLSGPVDWHWLWGIAKRYLQWITSAIWHKMYFGQLLCPFW